MNLSNYYSVDDGVARFTKEAASAFAKTVAGDYNPLHDPDNKRFCVPGDLLFSVVLNRYGLSENTEVEFAGMIDGNTGLQLPAALTAETVIQDTRDRNCLIARCTGKVTTEESFVSELTEKYVTFSGLTFPDVLEPLMRDNEVMINPSRPLVIYQSMQLTMSELSGTDLAVDLADASMSVEGKKGVALLRFNISAQKQIIGTGLKTMVLGGLRPYDAEAMQQVVDDYQALKA